MLAYDLAFGLISFASATPTAAPVQDRPTNLSSLIGCLSLALPAWYSSAHTSDTASTNRL